MFLFKSGLLSKMGGMTLRAKQRFTNLDKLLSLLQYRLSYLDSIIERTKVMTEAED